MQKEYTIQEIFQLYEEGKIEEKQIFFTDSPFSKNMEVRITNNCLQVYPLEEESEDGIVGWGDCYLTIGWLNSKFRLKVEE